MNDDREPLHLQFALTWSVVENGVCTFLLFLLVERKKGVKKGPALNASLYLLAKYLPSDTCEKGF